MEEGDCTIAATVLSLPACTCLLSFCVLIFVFFFLSKTAIWIGMARNGFGIFFGFIPILREGEDRMGKRETQDVDRTSKAVLIRIVSTMVMKRRNIIDS